VRIRILLQQKSFDIAESKGGFGMLIMHQFPVKPELGFAFAGLEDVVLRQECKGLSVGVVDARPQNIPPLFLDVDAQVELKRPAYHCLPNRAREPCRRRWRVLQIKRGGTALPADAERDVDPNGTV